MKISALLFVVALFGCNQLSPTAVDTADNSVVVKENPYTVANMSKAAEALGYESPKATHLYVKTRGVVDTDLITFYYPIEEERPEGVIEHTGWNYTWFPIGRKVNFTYELISEIVLQDDKLAKSLDNYAEIEFESKKLTGNLPKDASLKKALAWYPEGRIRILDDTINGKLWDVWEVTVQIHDWFKHASINTNKNGYFKCGHTSFSGSVTYGIRLNSPGWKTEVLDKEYNTVLISGPKKNNSGWWYDIKDVNSLEWFNMAVYFGSSSAYQYSGTNYTPKIGIRALNEKSPGTLQGEFTYDRLGAGCAHVWRYTKGGKKMGFLNVATTAAHESGHHMHWKMDKDTYWKATFKLQEAWAGVRSWDVSCYILGANWTTMPSSKPWYEMMLATNIIHYQFNKPDEGCNSEYYPLFVDLKDTYNQNQIVRSYPEDYVDGKSTLTMERILKDNKCKSFDNFMDAFVREDKDDYMFEYFRYWWGRGF